jgi:hypothetical protein
MFLPRGFVFSYEAVRDWEAKLTPTLAEKISAGDARAKLVAAGMLMKPTFECVANGGINIVRSIAMARLLTSC